MSPRQKARLIFSLALLLLISSGIATSFSIVGLVNSTKWVTHTYDVKQSISKIESVFALAGRTRARFVASGDASARAQYNSAITLLQSELQDAERDISDNPVQRENVAQLQLLVNKRIEVFTSSINTYTSGKTDPDEQLLFNAQSLQLADDSNEVMSTMQDEEDRLLVERLRVSDR